MKKCPKCGKEYPDIKSFCTICKERLMIKEDVVEKERKHSKEKRPNILL